KVKNVYWCAPRPGPSILFLPAAAVALMGVSEQSFDGGLRRRTIDNRRFKSMVIERIVRDLLIYAMLLLAIAPFSPVYAQVAGATLSGTVTDASGAAVPNAKVSIKNSATGVARDVTTDSAGFYSVPNLLPGVYNTTVEAAGFSTSVQTGLTLSVGASKALNIALQVGQVSEKVEVTAAAPTVELTSSTISGEV